MRIKILNDLHLGVQRSAGTTLASRAALHKFQIQELVHLLDSQDDCEVVLVNGDLFDTFNVPTNVLRDTYFAFREFLSTHPNTKLYLSEGNHDLSKDNQKVSSLRFLHELLSADFDVTLISGASQEITEGVLVVPHIRRQDDFEKLLGNLPTKTKYLLLHANYNNPFAGEFDHSLNVTKEMADTLHEQGCFLIFGHEHNHREVKGKLLITGNQIPTSIDDVRNGDSKHYWILDPRLEGEYAITAVECWEAKGFASLDWKNAFEFDSDHEFIRITGDYTPGEAIMVMDTVSQVRDKSKAFIVSNQTKVITTELEAFTSETNDFEITQYLSDECPAHLKPLLQELLS